MENEIQVEIGERGARAPVSPKMYRERSPEEVAQMLQGHESGERDYTLIASKYIKFRGELPYKRGDVVKLSLGQATRLLTARAVAPTDHPEARRARLQAAQLTGDEDATRQLRNEDIEAKIAALRAEQERLQGEMEEGA